MFEFILGGVCGYVLGNSDKPDKISKAQQINQRTISTNQFNAQQRLAVEQFNAQHKLGAKQ